MLNTGDEQWLRERYPGLVSDAKGVTGNIKFKATYNSEIGRFLILGDGIMDGVGGLALSGEFTIRIEERTSKIISSLPAVYVENVNAIPDRHFGQADKSACLCSPLEECDFLLPEFQFRVFLEHLVIPFLYGQIFYSQTQRWPWPEYAHGSAGLLEAYSHIADGAKTEECLRRLVQDKNVWPRIAAALRQKPYIKGHTPCFCPQMDQIRRCHPIALRGVQRLQDDIRALRLPIPS